VHLSVTSEVAFYLQCGVGPKVPLWLAVISKLVVLQHCNIQITSTEGLEHFRCPIKYVKDGVLAPELATYENLRLCIEVGWVKKSHPTCGVIRCIFCMSTSTRTISVCASSRVGRDSDG